MRRQRDKGKNPGEEWKPPAYLLSACRYLDDFLIAVNDEIWVVSMKYLHHMNHNYFEDYFHSHEKGKPERRLCSPDPSIESFLFHLSLQYFSYFYLFTFF